jgi:glycosyltransferase involved in cell wall biosynthesis
LTRQAGPTDDSARRRVVLLAAASFAMAGHRGSGFNRRYTDIAEMLAADHYVECVIVGTVGPGHSDEPLPVGIPVRHVHGPRWPLDRVRRLTFALTTLAGRGRWLTARWERELLRDVRSSDPDVILVFACAGPWPIWLSRVSPFRSVVRRLASVTFVEEDLTPSLPHLVRRSAKSRIVEGIDAAAERHLLAGRRVVIISPNERAWADRRYARSEIDLVPFMIDPASWRTASDRAPRPGEVCRVLAVGDLAAGRYRDGMEAILDELSRQGVAGRFEITVVSHSGLPDGFGAGYDGALEVRSDVDDLRPCYERCDLALVPSFGSSGIKTTLLQAWASRRLVVTTSSAAATVAGRHGQDLLAGDSPADVVGALVQATDDHAAAVEVVDAAWMRLCREFTADAVRAALRIVGDEPMNHVASAS